jgi:pyruvate kinase
VEAECNLWRHGKTPQRHKPSPSKVSAPSLTEKDFPIWNLGLRNDVEWVALSFVRKVEDVVALREIIEAHGKDTRIIAKIEKPEAIKILTALFRFAMH